MSRTTFSDIPRSALARLLDAVGQPQSMSPRLMMGHPAELTPPMLAELYGGNFINLPDKADVTLTTEFVKVARVILDPRTNVTIRIWGNNSMCGETNIQFPSDIMTGSGVILNQLGRMYRISAFVDDATITGLLRDAIPEPTEKDIQFEFQSHLDNTVAAVLFAIIDLARRKVMGTKRLVPLAELVFPTLDVYNFMYTRWGLTGFKDLITYITAVGIMPEAPSLVDTADGLSLLAKADLLKEVNEGLYGLTEALEPIVRLTAGQPAGLQWQRISLLANGEQLINNRTFLFGDKSFMLCFIPTVKGRMFISRIRRKEITDFLAEEIMATLVPVGQELVAPQTEAEFVTSMTFPAEPSVVAPRQAETSALPLAQAHPAAAAALFSPTEQAQSISETAACAKCEFISSKDALFCGKCGIPLEKTAIPPYPPSLPPHSMVCLNCNKILGLNAKFCSGCGKAV